MWKKNLTISLTLFMIFMVSAFVVHASVATTNSNSGSNNTISNQKVSQSGNSTADITALNYNTPDIVIGDGILSAIWSHVTKFYPKAWDDGTTKGYIQTLHDANNIYAVIAFPTDANWAGIEWNANTKTAMESGHDGWIFGASKTNSFYGDMYFVGEAVPVPDAQKDVAFEKIATAPTGMVIYEVQRALDTHDTAGHDVVFNDSTTMNVRFASGFGSKTHTAQPLTQIDSFAVSSTNLVVATQTTTTTSTTTTPVAVVRAEALNNVLVWGSITLFFNIIVINLLVMYHRRSS